MINIKNIVSFSLVVFAACSDHNEPAKKDGVPLITPRGIQKPRKTEKGSYTVSNYSGPGLTVNSQNFWDDDLSDISNESSDESKEDYYWPTGKRNMYSKPNRPNVYSSWPMSNMGYDNRNAYGVGGYVNNRYTQGSPPMPPYNEAQMYDYENRYNNYQNRYNEYKNRYNDYQKRYQNRGRPITMPPQQTNNENRMNYGNLMDGYENINSFNNGYDSKRRKNNKTMIGGQDYSGTGVGKSGIGVEFTDNGTLVNGKITPEYDVGNQRVNVDMTGDVFTINGQKVKVNSKEEKQYNDGGITMDGKRFIPTQTQRNRGVIVQTKNDESPIDDGKVNLGQVKGNQGTSQNFMEGGLTIDGENIPGNVYGNKHININRTPDGLMINGKQVPGVNAYDKTNIDWCPEGGFSIKGEYKVGFEDIKGKGRTCLPIKPNPANIDGSRSSQVPKTGKKYQKKKVGWVENRKNVGNGKSNQTADFNNSSV